MATDKPIYQSKTAWLAILFLIYCAYCFGTGTAIDMTAFSAFIAGLGLTFRHAIAD